MKDTLVWPDWEMTPNASAGYHQMTTDTISGYHQIPVLTEDQREEIKEKFRKKIFLSNPYPEYISPPWGE
jgi:hypothetical protein